MATVEGITVEKAQEIEDASVVSGSINGSGRLILVKGDGSTIDAGQVVASYDPAPLNAHAATTTGVHGVGAGTVVGTTLTQTMTNKTLTNPTLTTPTIASMINAQHNHGSTAGGGSLNVDAVLASLDTSLTPRTLASGEVGTPRVLAATDTLTPGKYLLLGSCRGYSLDAGSPTRVGYYLGTTSGTLYNSPIDVQNEQVSRQGGASVIGWLENSSNAVVSMYVEKMNTGEVANTSADGMLLAIRLSDMT